MATLPAADAADTAGCQSAGWNMNAELKAFGGPSQSLDAAAGATATATAPVLKAGTLYALRLRAQGEVHFVQASSQPTKSATPMAGLVRFTVPARAMYRITVDSPLWIDVVSAAGIVAPSTYTGWHECTLFRKSVVYSLEAGAAVTLQLSDAATDLVKLTIEPVPP